MSKSLSVENLMGIIDNQSENEKVRLEALKTLVGEKNESSNIYELKNKEKIDVFFLMLIKAPENFSSEQLPYVMLGLTNSSSKEAYQYIIPFLDHEDTIVFSVSVSVLRGFIGEAQTIELLLPFIDSKTNNKKLRHLFHVLISSISQNRSNCEPAYSISLSKLLEKIIKLVITPVFQNLDSLAFDMYLLLIYKSIELVVEIAQTPSLSDKLPMVSDLLMELLDKNITMYKNLLKKRKDNIEYVYDDLELSHVTWDDTYIDNTKFFCNELVKQLRKIKPQGTDILFDKLEVVWDFERKNNFV